MICEGSTRTSPLVPGLDLDHGDRCVLSQASDIQFYLEARAGLIRLNFKPWITISTSTVSNVGLI